MYRCLTPLSFIYCVVINFSFKMNFYNSIVFGANSFFYVMRSSINCMIALSMKQNVTRINAFSKKSIKPTAYEKTLPSFYLLNINSIFLSMSE